MKGWVAGLLILIVIAGMYLYYNPSTTVQLISILPSKITNSLGQLAQSNQTVCISQVNDALAPLKAKLPSGSTTENANTMTFTASDNIAQWIKTWSTYSIDCSTGIQNSVVSGMFGYQVCKDVQTITPSRIIPSNQVIGYGVAVRMASSNGAVVVPLLCDSNGNLLPNSKSILTG